MDTALFACSTVPWKCGMTLGMYVPCRTDSPGFDFALRGKYSICHWKVSSCRAIFSKKFEVRQFSRTWGASCTFSRPQGFDG